MSCDWHVHCVDCNETHRFDDANHRDDLMRLLIKHADAIAAVAPLLADPEARERLEFKTYYGSIDADWFAKHRGHQLRAIDEYGRLDTQCHGYFRCGNCDHDHACRLDRGHEGDHARIRL